MYYKKTILKELNSILSEHTPTFKQQKLVLKEYLNEAWFSDMLGWLLNPKATHGYNTKFSKSFLYAVAKERKKHPKKFSQNKQFLKTDNKSGSGNGVGKLKLNNSAVIREFFLSAGCEKKYLNKKGPKYCDIVLLDLDYSDSLFLTIENKLFSSNHPFQLQEYHFAVENKYKGVKIRDYVYLTLNGANPQYYGVQFGKNKSKEESLYKNWVCISWVQNILPILEKLESSRKGKKVYEIEILIKLLNWFKSLEKQSKLIGEKINAFRNILIESAAECLLEKLILINNNKPGRWEPKNMDSSIHLAHSSCRKRKLILNMLPNFTITIQSKFKSKSPLSEKIIVPFGANIDQVFNLISYSAKDIYRYHFPNPVAYMNKSQVIPKNKQLTIKQKEHKEIFQFAYEHASALKILMAYSSACWKAMDEEIRSEYNV